MKLEVKAIGVNRADVFFRQGKYPVQGLEVAGVAEDGRKFAAIMDGGAFAEQVEVQEEYALEIPQVMEFVEAVAIIESLFTAYYNLVILGKLQAGEKVLIHGGGSGVGVVAIQLAKLLGAEVYATSGKPEKLDLIKSLGADPIDYRKKDFGKDKYDVILDIVGADYFNANITALKKGGRLTIISFIGGARGEFNLAPLLIKDLSVFGSTIRGLSLSKKREIRDAIAPYFGKIKPIIAKTFPLEEKEAALDYIEQYKNAGKIVVTV